MNEVTTLRKLVKLAIVVILFLVASLIWTAVRHASEMNECYVPGESIQLEADHRPAVMITSLVHTRRVWRV
jgi:hypothetical protein